MALFPTTTAGSLPKPAWLAEQNKLWPAWKASGEALAKAKLDATTAVIKLQEDAGIGIVTDGEQSRQHFVHGFLENIEGIDFAHKVEMGIRNDRYKAMVPTSTENDYWASFQFNDAAGNVNKTYVVANGSSYFSADLGATYSGLGGTRIPYKVISNARMTNGRFYLTNAVKHFSFHREGKRRIHEKPRAKDVRACRPWLENEIDRLKPEVMVCFGSTAAQALLGPSIRIRRDRGQEFRAAWAPRLIVTYHPSAVLRADDPKHADEILRWLTEDLRRAATPQGK